MALLAHTVLPPRSAASLIAVGTFAGAEVSVVLACDASLQLFQVQSDSEGEWLRCSRVQPVFSPVRAVHTVVRAGQKVGAAGEAESVKGGGTAAQRCTVQLTSPSRAQDWLAVLTASGHLCLLEFSHAQRWVAAARVQSILCVASIHEGLY